VRSVCVIYMAWAIWITGLPGSGKTTIAHEVVNRLKDRKLKMLQLDEIRAIVTPTPTYSEAERDILYSFLAYMAKVLTECGINVIIDATANRRRYRELARMLIPHFAEVYIRCSLETCILREARRVAKYSPKGIYEKSKKKGAEVPGVNVAYEETYNPEVKINSDDVSPQEAAELIIEYIGRP
jgi:adenylylsulfate kinase